MRRERSVPHILLIDDEPSVLMFVGSHLRQRGYQVSTARSGDTALELAARRPCDLIVLDLTLPTLDGLEVLRRLREWTATPVIVLSGRGEEQIKVQALDRGADDYLTKPFGIEELLARIRVALRRVETRRHPDPAREPAFVADSLEVDLARRLVRVGGHEIRLTPTEYDLLHCFIRHAGKVLTHRELLQDVWGPEYGGESEYLRTFVKNLRRKLGDDPAHPRYILTVPGVGYRLIVSAEAPRSA